MFTFPVKNLLPGEEIIREASLYHTDLGHMPFMLTTMYWRYVAVYREALWKARQPNPEPSTLGSDAIILALFAHTDISDGLSSKIRKMALDLAESIITMTGVNNVTRDFNNPTENKLLLINQLLVLDPEFGEQITLIVKRWVNNISDEQD